MSHGLRVYRTKPVSSRLAGPILIVAFALLVAACGGGSSVSAAVGDGASTTATSRAPTPASKTSPSVVITASAKYGKRLTNARGFALYTYTADKPGKTGCTGACLKYWPPLLLPAGVSHPTAGPGVTGLGTFARSASTQVTYDGLPLYTYLNDTRPGQVTGQHVADGGGTWDLAIAGSAPPTAPSSTAPSAAAPSTVSGPSPSAPRSTQAPSLSVRPPPSATQTPPTQPPATQPPAVQQPITLPPVTAPPATQAPITSPPATRPPVTSPPPTSPPTAPPGGPAY